MPDHPGLPPNAGSGTGVGPLNGSAIWAWSLPRLPVERFAGCIGHSSVGSHNGVVRRHHHAIPDSEIGWGVLEEELGRGRAQVLTGPRSVNTEQLVVADVRADLGRRYLGDPSGERRFLRAARSQRRERECTDEDNRTDGHSVGRSLPLPGIIVPQNAG